MITRFSFRHWIAALSLGLSVPFLAGCAGRGQQVAQTENGKFWRQPASAQAEVAKADAEPAVKAEEPAGAGRVRIASLGEAETTKQVAGSDPFLNEPEPTTKPVAQVAAEEPKPRTEPKAARSAPPQDDQRVAAIDAELERLRRDAMAVDEDAEKSPSLEWADDVASVDEPAAQPAQEAPAQSRPDVADSVSADDLAAWGDDESVDTAANEPAEAPMSREVAPVEAIDRSMIVDTLEINPRRIHDPSVRGTSGRADVVLDREVESSETRDALWSFEQEELESEPAPAPIEEEASTPDPGEELALVANSEPSPEEVPTFGNPVLLPPTAAAEEDVAEPAVEDSTVSSLSGPSLLGPPTDDSVADAPVEPADESVDAFPFDPDPEVVTALDALEFAEEPEAATTASNSSIGWWFGGFAIAAIVLLVRARRRLFA